MEPRLRPCHISQGLMEVAESAVPVSAPNDLVISDTTVTNEPYQIARWRLHICQNLLCRIGLIV